MLSSDNSVSSNSSFPNSSWADWGIDWNGTSRMEGPFDPSAPQLPDPPALEAPSVAAGVSDVSGLGSLGFSAVSILGQLAVGFSINPITGESGADRLASSEPLDTQLRKSWTWSFSCAERCWTLAKQRFWIRKLRQMGYNQQKVIYLLAVIEMRNFPLQHWSKSHLPFFAVIRISIRGSRRHTIPGFIILLQKEANT